MLAIKTILIVCLGMIVYQDLKERQVFWFLFPMVALCSGVVFYRNTLPELFYLSVGTNLMFIMFLLVVVFLYSKIKLGSNFSDVFGLGDVLLFLGSVFTFATVSFLVVFVFSLLFSLILHLMVKRYSTFQTVPLAGYISLFFGMVYLADWSGIISSLYAL